MISRKWQILTLLAVAVVSTIIGGLIRGGHYWGGVIAVLATGISILIAIQDISKRLWAIADYLPAHSRALALSLVVEIHSMETILERYPECTIPTSGWSMRFSNIHTILDILDRYRPKTIVEFGSGISTLCIAAWLKEQGEGKIISFDHDVAWARKTERYLHEKTLDGFATVVFAPLIKGQSLGHDVEWYDISNHIKKLNKIDLLIVDGPPADSLGKELSRLPALDVLANHLSTGAIIMLDDASRKGEQTVINMWLNAFPEFKVRQVETLTGLAILERSDG